MIVIPQASLQEHNTLAVPSTAEYLCRITTTEELEKVRQWLQANPGKQWRAIGGGSNIILPPFVEGLVICNEVSGIEVVAESDDETIIKVGAGENWHELVHHCVNFGYWGIENLALIPGTAGAAPIQNIGAYGVELKDVLLELEAYDMASGLMVTFDNSGCRFGYRDSIFKHSLKNSYVITQITLRLSNTPAPQLNYPALGNEFENTPQDEVTMEDIFNKVCEIRSQKLPNPDEIPNAGSFFKNPIIQIKDLHLVEKAFNNREIPQFPATEGHVKIPAAWLIDQAGWKGTYRNGVGVHDKQALVITNPGHKSSTEILALAQDIQKDIQARTGIELEIEPQLLD